MFEFIASVFSPPKIVPFPCKFHNKYRLNKRIVSNMHQQFTSTRRHTCKRESNSGKGNIYLDDSGIKYWV